jgi:hypothetical protein
MNLNAEQISSNWEEFLGNIETHISSPRKEKLLEFYTSQADRFVLMPAAANVNYHNCFPGGYVEHVNRVVKASLEVKDMWERFGADMTTFTVEELVFSAINHDLGKLGDSTSDLYIPSNNDWRKKNLGEHYSYNKEVGFMTIPDRSLFLLQEASISYTMNEMLAIRAHDGLYDDSNKPYFISRIPESRPKSIITFILHQADFLAAEVERHVNAPTRDVSKNFTAAPKVRAQAKAKTTALGSVGEKKGDGLKNIMDSFFDD